MQVAYIVCRGFFTARLVYLEQVFHVIRILFNKLFYGFSQAYAVKLLRWCIHYGQRDMKRIN